MLKYVIPALALLLAAPVAAPAADDLGIAEEAKCGLDRITENACNKAHATCLDACAASDRSDKDTCRTQCGKAGESCLAMVGVETVEKRHRTDYVRGCTLIRTPEVFSKLRPMASGADEAAPPPEAR